MEKDFKEICDEQIPQIMKVASSWNYDKAINSLINLEKLTRNGGDAISTGRVLVAIVEILFKSKNWNSLNENLIILTKKRFQLKEAVVVMIQKCIEFIDEIANKDEKLKLIENLRLITDGKIHLESERAHLTKILSLILEANGEIAKAYKIMEEVQIEAFSSIGNKEKMDFLLEQMRLSLANKDSIKTQIISKKINKNLFKNSEYHPLKFKYYGIMILLEEQTSFLNTSCHYQAVLNTELVLLSSNRRQRMMSCAILYCVLAPFDNEQSNMMLNLLKNKICDEIPNEKEILKLFLSKDLISWSKFCENYTKNLLCFSFFNLEETHGKNCWKNLRSRVIENNIRIIALFYTRIYISRLSELLSLQNEETEEFVINLIGTGTIQAKIDRPLEIIIFTKSTNGDEMLNKWSSDVRNIMDLIKKTTHLIDCVDKI